MKSSSPHKKLKAECDRLWSQCVKARAGNKSEISGKTENLNAHHLRGKSSYSMRYSLANGFCCTSGEHIFGFHRSDRRERYEAIVRKKRGDDIFEKLEMMRSYRGKTDLTLVKCFLERELKRLKNESQST